VHALVLASQAFSKPVALQGANKKIGNARALELAGLIWDGCCMHNLGIGRMGLEIGKLAWLLLHPCMSPKAEITPKNLKESRPKAT
jgi:hypothetical protein